MYTNNTEFIGCHRPLGMEPPLSVAYIPGELPLEKLTPPLRVIANWRWLLLRDRRWCLLPPQLRSLPTLTSCRLCACSYGLCELVHVCIRPAGSRRVLVMSSNPPCLLQSVSSFVSLLEGRVWWRISFRTVSRSLTWQVVQLWVSVFILRDSKRKLLKWCPAETLIVIHNDELQKGTFTEVHHRPRHIQPLCLSCFLLWPDTIPSLSRTFSLLLSRYLYNCV